MANVQKVPGKTQLRRYLSQGLTQAQIVEAWEEKSGIRCSRASIGMAIERYDLKSVNPRHQYPDMLPWVLGKHTHKLDARMLRLVARKQRGMKISTKEEIRLAKWLADLKEQNAVIYFNADLPEGFRWIEREPRHGDDLIDRSNATKTSPPASEPGLSAPVARRVRATKRDD